MKELLIKNKAVIRFLVIFLGCYLVLAGLYKLYLFYGSSEVYYPDYVTHLVAQQSEALITSFGYEAKILPHPNEASMKLYIQDLYLARIVEGCNAMSVIILFVSFIFAFHTKLKPTLLYAFAGSILLYVMNIIRIAVLCIGIYEYPEYQEILHDTVFPAIIYGSVFILWLVWVKYVTGREKQQK